MRVAVLSAAVLAIGTIVLAPPSARAQEDFAPRITVPGEATVELPPDMARLRAGVVTVAGTAREAGEHNDKTMNAVVTAIRNAGIEDKDFQTSRFQIQPVAESDARKIKNFRAANQVTVTIRDIAKIAEIIDRLVAAGANEVSGVEFIVSSRSEALDRARGQAVADARRKAEIYAKAAGVAVGRPFSIVEQSSGAQPVHVFYARAEASAPTPIQPGEQTLRVSVSVTFDLMR